ncbi:MAG TPA: hypothetical protein PLS55_09985, partial [Thermogutta sp.]|nr:hypothetical protein [Thermogutta sp.]
GMGDFLAVQLSPRWCQWIIDGWIGKVLQRNHRHGYFVIATAWQPWWSQPVWRLGSTRVDGRRRVGRHSVIRNIATTRIAREIVING